MTHRSGSPDLTKLGDEGKSDGIQLGIVGKENYCENTLVGRSAGVGMSNLVTNNQEKCESRI